MKQALGLTVLVESRTFDSFERLMAYYQLNNLMSQIIVHDILEHGHVDIVVPLHNNIDIIMTTNNSLLSFWSTMKKNIDILCSEIYQAGEMYMCGHCNQTNHQKMDV